MELPPFLLEQIRRGQVVLFLGAGASYGCMNRMGESPPLGNALAEQLSKQAGLPFEIGEDDLATVAGNAKNRLGDDAYLRFLRDRYQRCVPSPALIQLSQFPWYRIYTLNIDDALEAAYAKSDYFLDISVHRSPLMDRPQDGSAVQLIKLNGSIDRLESGLIFTPEEYQSFAGSYGTWYEQVANDYLRYTFLFVGTKLNEPLFRHNVDRLMRLKGHRPGTAFIVAPHFSENRKAQLESENILPIEGGVQDLADALLKDLGRKISITEMLKSQHPNLQQLISRIPTSQLPEISGQLDQLELVLPDRLRSSLPSAKSGVRDFYYGSEPVWRDVVDGVPAETSGYGELLAAINSGASIIQLHGPAGSGKTTAMMMAAYAVAAARPVSFIVWVRGVADFPRDAIERLASSGVEEVIAFVDDFSVHAGELLRLMSKGIKSLKFVISDRTHLIPSPRSDYYVHPKKDVTLRRLSGSDIDEVLNKLQQFGPWDRLGKMPVLARRRAIEVVAEKQLLVGLREATQGIGFDKIAASEYERIVGDYAKCAYLVVAVASMHRLEMSTATFEIAVRNMLLPETPIPPVRLSGLEDIVFQRGGWLRIRHQILAEFTMSRVVPRAEVLRAVSAVMKSLSRYPSPLRRSANKAETRLFAAITNHEFLWRLFRNERDLVLSNFAFWERHFANDGLFWLQYALFEELCGAAHLSSAVNHIRTAMRIYPGSHQVINAYANIHFALALHAKRAEEGLMLMEQATQSIVDQASDRLTEAYTAVALARGRIAVLKKWYPERLPAELKEAEQRLRDVFRNDPGNRTVQEAINQLHLSAVTGRSAPGRKGRRRSRR